MGERGRGNHCSMQLAFRDKCDEKNKQQTREKCCRAMCFLKPVFCFLIYHELPVTQQDDEGPSCILLTCVMAVTREYPPSPFCFIQCCWQPHRNKKPAPLTWLKSKKGDFELFVIFSPFAPKVRKGGEEEHFSYFFLFLSLSGEGAPPKNIAVYQP